jgi:hypothetical protein
VGSLTSQGSASFNYIGRVAIKEFPNQGAFTGKVTAYDETEGLWQVTYADGDQEEYAAEELEAYLAPELPTPQPNSLKHQLFSFSTASAPTSDELTAEDTKTYPCFKCSGLVLASRLLLCDGKALVAMYPPSFSITDIDVLLRGAYRLRRGSLPQLCAPG